MADIVEMHPYSSFNRGHYILTVIDVLSKYAWVVPLKSKGGSETANAIAQFVRERKMSEKFTNGYGERILQCRYTEYLEKTQL